LARVKPIAALLEAARDMGSGRSHREGHSPICRCARRRSSAGASLRIAIPAMGGSDPRRGGHDIISELYPLDSGSCDKPGKGAFYARIRDVLQKYGIEIFGVGVTTRSCNNVPSNDAAIAAS